jgi:hypothetical protein
MLATGPQEAIDRRTPTCHHAHAAGRAILLDGHDASCDELGLPLCSANLAVMNHLVSSASHRGLTGTRSQVNHPQVTLASLKSGKQQQGSDQSAASSRSFREESSCCNSSLGQG